MPDPLTLALIAYATVGVAAGLAAVPDIADVFNDSDLGDYATIGFIAVVTAVLWPLMGLFVLIGWMANRARRLSQPSTEETP